MALTGLTDYSTTPASNVDIGGISTDGATQTVNNVDNLIRELMSHLATHVATPTFVSTSAAASSGPAITLYRNSATPAASDFIGTIIFNGEDSVGNTQTYGEITGVIVDPTSTSEDGKIAIYTTIAGTAAARVTVGAGLSMAAAADPGAGEIAAAGLDLSAGATIVWGAADVTLTHTTNTLTFTGATSNGYVFDSGLDISGANAGNIVFPATQNGTVQANTLDDYEEGTSTPTVTATSGAFTTVSCALGYTKVGNNVDVRAVITITNAGTAAGGLVFDVPFSAGTNVLVSGFESATGYAANGNVVTATATVYKYDGTTIIGSSRVLHIHTNFRT